MPMRNYLTVTVPPELLSQITGEILKFTTDPNKVEVVHAEAGRVLHVDPLVAEAWMEWRQAREEEKAAEVAGEVIKEPAPPEPTPAPVPAAPPKKSTPPPLKTRSEEKS